MKVKKGLREFVYPIREFLKPDDDDKEFSKKDLRKGLRFLVGAAYYPLFRAVGVKIYISLKFRKFFVQKSYYSRFDSKVNDLSNEEILPVTNYTI